MNKRERLENAIAGEPVDRIPVSLWRHWPGDDQRAADLARSLIDFQRDYNWDFVRVMPSRYYSVTDYGLQDEWQGAATGQREISRHLIKRSLDWTELRTLDPERGQLGQQLACLRLMEDSLDESIPILPTIYSPMLQAEFLGGTKRLFQHMRTRPDRLRTGLNILTESTLRFIEALRRIRVDGLFYVIKHASHEVMTEAEYRTFGLPFDTKILESVPEKWWFNVAQFQGQSPMLNLVDEYPVQVVNWADSQARHDLSEGKTWVKAALCGGIAQWQHLHQGTPATIRDRTREAISQTDGRRFILSVGTTALITSPLSNIRAVREAVESILV